MRSRLNRVARLLGHDRWDGVPWQALRYEQVAGLIAQLQESGEAPASINLALSALRGTAKAAFNLGLVEANDLARIQSIRRVGGERLPRGRAVTADELRALMQACAADPGAAGIRDAAILAVLYAGGLRRAEVVALDVESYDPGTGDLETWPKSGGEEGC
jgi:site-specific recombinase XerC